ncbi:MAG: class I SAM-dependent rRNA methyltransferase [Bacteroidales bacterium]|nr:class I SAM-dependent rRNA methyltransferase [Bacteroidales bacterium]
MLPTVYLKIDRRSSHPWIFQKMVEKPATRIPPGSVVDVVERSGQWVARGFYNGHSRIAVRVLTADANEAIDEAFLERKLSAAITFRREMLKLDTVTDAYRLVHSEADGLSGLVVDRFGDTIVIEYFSAGAFRLRDTVRAVLDRQFPGSRFYWFAEEHVQKQESFDCRAPEPPAPGVIREHGLQFRVAPGSKHKTGFFVDQRDNRKTLSTFCAGKSVLDLCCNSGGFSVYAKALGGASTVTGVDLDEQAIDMAKQNAKLNKADIRFVQADLFTWLRDILPNGQRFDTVILDPAKMTRDREAVDFALKKYCDMNRLALQAVAPGGVFLTCSCTGLVSEADFLESIRRAAWQAGRTVQVFQVSGAGADHPYLLHVPEGRYLKAVFCRVM